MKLRDPVCGMEIGWEEAVDHVVVGPVVMYFCCAGCARKFRNDPVAHVDVRAGLGDEPPVVEPGACGGEPRGLDAAGVARKSISCGAVPRIGRHTIDEVDALVVRRWRRLLGPERTPTLRARVLERALLLRAVAGTEEELAYAERALAAEVVRLRSRDPDREGLRRELDALSSAFETVLLDLEVGPDELARAHERIASGLAESRRWVFSPPRVPPQPSWRSPGARRSVVTEKEGPDGRG